MNSDLVSRLMFDWMDIEEGKILQMSEKLSPKILRWLGANHPDNKTRKIFFELTGIKVGIDTVINHSFVVSDDYESLLTIGSRVAISPNVTIICASAPNNSLIQNLASVEKLICKKPVSIGDDVWIGANAVIMPGVSIGEKSIIGAGSIVTRDVQSKSIYAGNPAKKLRDI